MRLTESVVHCAVRAYLKRSGWTLVAGQFPGGSDDECHVLNVMDPTLSGDNCPDPSRHSENKIVPDLFALRNQVLLVIEMKPRFSSEDELKLKDLLGPRRGDLNLALSTFARDRSLPLIASPASLLIVPALGFGHASPFVRDPAFCYFLTKSIDEVSVIPASIAGPSTIDHLFI